MKKIIQKCDHVKQKRSLILSRTDATLVFIPSLSQFGLLYRAIIAESCGKVPSPYKAGNWLYADSRTILNSRSREDDYISSPLMFNKPESLIRSAPMKIEPNVPFENVTT